MDDPNSRGDERDEDMEKADTANGEGDAAGRNDTEDRYGPGESPA